MRAWLCKSLLKTLSVHAQSTVAHAIKKLSEDCVADESEDDGSGTEEVRKLSQYESMNSVVLAYLQFTTMPHMSCAAHTLQLAMCHSSKIGTVASLIMKIRWTAGAARTPKIDVIIKRKMNQGAILDQANRWGRKYFIVKRLFSIKDALVDITHPDMCLLEGQWNNVKSFECLLRHSFLFTKNLQTAYSMPRTFYKEWKKILFEFTQIGSVVADAMRKSSET